MFWLCEGKGRFEGELRRPTPPLPRKFEGPAAWFRIRGDLNPGLLTEEFPKDLGS